MHPVGTVPTDKKNPVGTVTTVKGTLIFDKLHTKLADPTELQLISLGVDFVFANNGQSLHNWVAEPLQQWAETPRPEPTPSFYHKE